MNNMSIKALIMASLLVLLAGCMPISYHNVQKESLMEQAQAYGSKFRIPAQDLTGYDFRTIKKIKCYNKKNEPVYISVDFNTQLELYTVSQGKVNMYFTTVALIDDTLYGLRSRILHLEKKVPLSDIKRIEIYSEFKKEQSATD